MTNDQIKHMVDRFLSWKLPDNFNPDGGASFKAEFNENTPWPMRHEPSGTNLLDYTQAEAMVRHMLEGLPDAAEGVDPDLVEVREIVANFNESKGHTLWAKDTRLGAHDGGAEMQAFLFAYKAGKEARQ